MQPAVYAVTPTREPQSLLQQVLSYQNSAVVDRYVQKLGLTEDEAQVLFEDTKKFLFLCATKRKGDFAVTPPKLVDAGWHEFLMFTEDYQEFCHAFFGRFIHHRPSRKGEPKQGGRPLKMTRELAIENFGCLSANWHVDLSDKGSCANCDGGGCNEPECHGDDPVM